MGWREQFFPFLKIGYSHVKMSSSNEAKVLNEEVWSSITVDRKIVFEAMRRDEEEQEDDCEKEVSYNVIRMNHGDEIEKKKG